MKAFDTIIKLLSELSDNELMALNRYLVADIKLKRARRVRQEALSFSRGDKVKFNDRLGREVEGIVEKVNRTTVSVTVERKTASGYATTGKWRVSPSLLRAA